MTCDVCGKECKNDRWSKIRAHDAGWFMQKNGTMYCPDHVPSWVTAWRERRSEEEMR